MRLLSRDNRILWVNSIGYRTPAVSKRDLSRAFNKLKAAASPLTEVEKNIFVLNPVAIPLYGALGQRANRWLLRNQVLRAMRRLGFRRPVNWVFNPAAAVIARQLNEDLLIYYCVDEYAAFSGVSAQSIGDMERRLLEQADLVVVSAQKLLESKRAVRPDTILLRHGVDYDHFRKALDPQTRVPPDLAALPGPVIGYFGLMADDWFDVDLMVKVARHFSHCSVALLGKVTMDLSALTALPNVHLLGRKPYETLPGYAKGFTWRPVCRSSRPTSPKSGYCKAVESDGVPRNSFERSRRRSRVLPNPGTGEARWCAARAGPAAWTTFAVTSPD
jgi:hypothetical protein